MKKGLVIIALFAAINLEAAVTKSSGTKPQLSGAQADSITMGPGPVLKKSVKTGPRYQKQSDKAALGAGPVKIVKAKKLKPSKEEVEDAAIKIIVGKPLIAKLNTMQKNLKTTMVAFDGDQMPQVQQKLMNLKTKAKTLQAQTGAKTKQQLKDLEDSINKSMAASAKLKTIKGAVALKKAKGALLNNLHKNEAKLLLVVHTAEKQTETKKAPVKATTTKKRTVRNRS